MAIKAIETRYAGCRFRSRLEARWAVFFDHLNIEWQYEPQGFELPSGLYLPDFYLPKHGDPDQPSRSDMWVEVKGKPATNAERRLADELSSATQGTVFVLEGDIPRSPTCLHGDKPALMAWSSDSQFGTEHACLVHSSRLQAALTAARSARFEHGERGVR